MADLTLFGQPASPATLTSDTTNYTLGVQFSVSQSTTLDGIWFFSASGAGSLPSTIALYNQTSGALITSQTPTWLTGPGGSAASAGSGWCFAAFTSPPTLTASTAYEGCVFNTSGTNWYSTTANYWSTGAGSSGITNGILSAPNNTNSVHGQDAYTIAGSLAQPTSTFNSSNYWIDVAVASGSTTHDITATTEIAASPLIQGWGWGSGETLIAVTGNVTRSVLKTIIYWVNYLAGSGFNAVPGISIPGLVDPGQPSSGTAAGGLGVTGNVSTSVIHGGFQLVLTALTTVTGAVTRQAGKSFGSFTVSRGFISRNLNKLVSVPVTVFSAVNSTKVKLVALAASLVTYVNVTRKSAVTQAAPVSMTGKVSQRIGRIISAVTTVTGTTGRALGRGFTIPVVITSSAVFIKVKQITLTASATLSGIVTRKISPILSGYAILNSGNIRAVTRTIQGTISIAGQTARGITRVFTTPATVTGKINVSRAYIIVAGTIMSVSSTVKRQVKVTQSTVAAITGNITRAARMKITGSVSAVISFTAGRPFVVHLATNVSVSASVTAKLIQTAFVILFKAGLSAGRWTAGQITRRWKTGP